MILKEYLEKINKLAEEHPEALELECFTSKDDEGNGYYQVVFDPSIEVMDENRDSCIHEDDLEEGDIPNAVILN